MSERDRRPDRRLQCIQPRRPPTNAMTTNINPTKGGPAADTPEGAPKPKSVSELPQETLDFAAKCFDLARNGDEAVLKPYLDAGLPANLTNSKGALYIRVLRGIIII